MEGHEHRHKRGVLADARFLVVENLFAGRVLPAPQGSATREVECGRAAFRVAAAGSLPDGCPVHIGIRAGHATLQ